MVEENEVIELIKEVFKDEYKRNFFLCYLLLTKSDEEFEKCKKSLNKLLED